MIGDDEVNAQLGGKLGFFYSGNAVVHGHDELAAPVVKGLDGIARKAVAIALPAWQHTFDRCSHALEMLVQQRRCRHAVHIIIAKNDNGLAIVNGPPDALTRFVHIGEQRRVAEFLFPGQQGQRFGWVGNAAGCQNACQQGVFFLLGGKNAAVFRIRPRLFLHRLLFQLFHGLFCKRLRHLSERRTIQRLQMPCTVGH